MNENQVDVFDSIMSDLGSVVKKYKGVVLAPSFLGCLELLRHGIIEEMYSPSEDEKQIDVELRL